MDIIVVVEIIGLGIVVAANPIPVVSQLSLVTRDTGPRAAVFFAAGWAAAVLIAVAALTASAAALWGSTATSDREPVWDPTVRVAATAIVGAVLVVLGVVFVRRPPRSPDAPPSRIARAFESITSTRAVLLGAGLAVIKPKTLVSLITAAAIIGAETDTFGQTAILIAIFTLVGSAAVALPVVLLMAGGRRTAEVLARVQEFLATRFTRLTGVLMLLIGIVVLLSLFGG